MSSNWKYKNLDYESIKINLRSWRSPCTSLLTCAIYLGKFTNVNDDWYLKFKAFDSNGKSFVLDQENVVRELISNFTDLQNAEENGNLPIHFAAIHSVSWKFSHKKYFQTIFQISNCVLKISFEDKESLVKMLFDQRSDMIDVKNDNGRTCLSLVVGANGEILRWIIMQIFLFSKVLFSFWSMWK